MLYTTALSSCYVGMFTNEQWKNLIFPVPYTPQTSCIGDAKYCFVIFLNSFLISNFSTNLKKHVDTLVAVDLILLLLSINF